MVYRHIRYDEKTNTSSKGFSELKSRLEGDFFSFQDSGSSHVLISDFGTIEYLCTGSCFCDNDRRFSVPIAQRVIYLVAAFSSLLAYNIAQEHFETVCKMNEFLEDCPVEKITSRVDDCETFSSKIEEDQYGTKYRNFRCRGHCVTETQPTQYLPDSSSRKKNIQSNANDKTIISSFDGFEIGKNEFFAMDRNNWRSWLEENHDKKDEVWLFRWKVHMKKRQITWDESVEEAICFGWIDSIYRRGEGEYENDLLKQRFTPRRPKGSKWSKYNIARAQKMISEGKMMESGWNEYKKWIDKHPEDVNGVEINDKECKKIKQEKNVKIFEDGSDAINYSGVDVARKKYMSVDLHSFCKHNSFRCGGHNGDYVNPTVKCIEI